MMTHFAPYRMARRLLLLAAGTSLLATAAFSQVPVDEHGKPVQPLDDAAVAAETADDTVTLMTADELQALVGPIALYPDDLLAIVLPASTYPLEIVQAARFLDDHEADDSLEPDESWDESVTALLNYPEVVEMMNDDLDWTWRLGEAVVNQQPDVISAVETFRDRAYAAGNLKSDEHQTVSKDDGVIEIAPVDEEIIYVPYYEPERVVVYQAQPEYYYYPRPYPVYYYPYPSGYSFHNFHSNYFWGVTTAFSVGWTTNHLHVFHHSYRGHPYYGHTYYPNWWYRRPSITVYNNWYNTRTERTRDHYANGDYWRPHHSGGARPGFHRSRAAYAERRRERSSDGYRDRPRTSGSAAARSSARNEEARSGFRSNASRPDVRTRNGSEDRAIRFRQRETQPATAAGRERAAGVNRERAPATRSNQAVERANASERRVERPASRVAPRPAANDASRRVTGQTSRAGSPALQRSSTTRPSANRATAERRTTAPSRAPAVSAPARSVSRPAASARRSAPSPAASAPRSVPRPAAAAPRSAPRPAASAPRATAPKSVSRPATSTRRPASGNDRRVRDR